MHHPHNSHDRNTVPRPHFPTSLPRVQLEIIQGQARHPMRQIEQRAYLFGSSQQCDLVLRDQGVEEVQGYILNTPQGVWVRQLGNLAPIAVNNRPVRCMMLLDKDRLSVGPFEFRIHIQTATAPVPSGAPIPVARPLPASRAATASASTHAGRTKTSALPAGRVDAPEAVVPAPKFLRRATAVSRGAQHSAVIPESWRHMSQELLSE